jgi:hypothetical protein
MKTIKLVKIDNKKFKLMGSGEIKEQNLDYYEIYVIEQIKIGPLKTRTYQEIVQFNFDADDNYWITDFEGFIRIKDLDTALKIFDLTVQQYSSNNGTKSIVKSVNI